MNMEALKCIICSFSGLAENQYFGALGCGHIFHNECIYEWLERSPTCPHCRVRASQEELVKLFFDVSEDNDFSEITSLKSEVDKLTALLQQTQSELKVKSKECKQLNDQFTSAHKHNLTLRKDVKMLTKKVEEVKSLKEELHQQKMVTKFTLISLEAERTDCEKYKKDLYKYKNIKDLLDGTVEEAEKVINNEEPIDYETMKTCFMTIKRDFKVLAESEEKLKKDYSSLYALHKTLRVKNDALHERCSIQKRVIENYQGKLKPPSNETLPLNESEQPMDIEESNQPNSSKQGNLPRRSPRNKRKNTALTMGAKIASTRQLSYDGLGGHSAVDIFPTAKLRACRIVSNRRK